MKKHLKSLFALALAMILAVPCMAIPANAEEATGEKTIQLLSTSDLHGKFVPFKYAIYEEDLSGSLAQAATLIKERRNDNTILLDVGDTIQDNSSDIFFEDDMHPMMAGLNLLNYDYWVVGNHEFNYGVDVLKKVIGQFKGTTLCGNVYDTDGVTKLGATWDIKEVDGVKVGIVGVVTPNIVQWDRDKLEAYTVTNPIDEIRTALTEIGDQADVLVLAVHAGDFREFDYYGSSADDLAAEFPEFTAVLAAHGHSIVNKTVNDGKTVITENLSGGQSISDIDITVKPNADGGYDVVNVASEVVKTGKTCPADAEVTEALESYNQKAKVDAQTFVGTLVGGDLVDAAEITGIVQSRIAPSAMMDLINTVQMKYSGADISAAGIFSDNANIKEGDIKKCDAALIYKFDNTLYLVEITGAQLKQYMEWSVGYYKQFMEGDLTISYGTMAGYLYDVFAGVTYDINVSKPAGERIENLKKSDGTPIKDDDVLTMALNNYRATSNVCTPGTAVSNVFKPGQETPKIIEKDCYNGIAIRDLITKYIQEEKNGTITPECANNWKIVGNDWDPALHARVAEYANAGLITVSGAKAYTVADLEAFEAEQLANRIDAVKQANVEVASLTPSYTSVKVALNPVEGADGYYVLYGTSASMKSCKLVDTEEATVTLTGLTSGKNYYVKALAYVVDADGSKNFSKLSSAKGVKTTTKMHTPGKAAISKLTSTTKGACTVTYAKVKYATKYKIEYTKDSKFKTGIKTVYTTLTTKTIKSLTSKKTYYVRVTAYAKDANGKVYSGKVSTVKKVTVK